MDGSVYTPSAGHLSPVLAGRDGLLHAMTVRLNDVATVGRTRAEDVVFTGVRGVGKTALLTAHSHAAAQQGLEVIGHQAVAGQAGLVESVMARAALRIDQGAGAWSRARRALERVSGVTLAAAGVSAGVNLHDRTDPPAAVRVHPEALAFALVALADEVRHDSPAGGVLLTVSCMQLMPDEQAWHRIRDRCGPFADRGPRKPALSIIKPPESEGSSDVEQIRKR